MPPFESLSIETVESDTEQGVPPAEGGANGTSCWQRPRHFCCGCCGVRVTGWKCVAGYGVALYVLVAIVVFFLQHFLFFPGWLLLDDRRVTLSPGMAEFEFKAAHSDGKVLRGVQWSELSALRALAFGGNAMDMYDSVDMCHFDLLPPIAKLLDKKALDAGCFSTSYRGYPPNAGWTSRASVAADAADLLDRALRPSGGGRRALLMGWSLGTAAAAQLAAREPGRVGGVLLLAPFASVSEETRYFIQGSLGRLGMLAYVALFPWTWTFHLDDWDTAGAVASLPADIPIAVVSPLDDTMISPNQHRAVFEASSATCRAFVPVSDANHASFSRMRREMMKPGAGDSAGCSMKEWAEAVISRSLEA